MDSSLHPIQYPVAEEKTERRERDQTQDEDATGRIGCLPPREHLDSSWYILKGRTESTIVAANQFYKQLLYRILLKNAVPTCTSCHSCSLYRIEQCGRIIQFPLRLGMITSNFYSSATNYYILYDLESQLVDQWQCSRKLTIFIDITSCTTVMQICLFCSSLICVSCNTFILSTLPRCSFVNLS